MNIPIIISIIGVIVALIAGLLIDRQKRVNRLNNSIQKTINSITKGKGRNCKVAILEDFPEHDRLAMELLPYLLFSGRRKTERAWENYKDWYETIDQAQKQDMLNILGADIQSEIETTVLHLTNLLKKKIVTTNHWSGRCTAAQF